MSLQRKSRFGATLMLIGSLLAAIGEIVNLQNSDILSSSWRLSLGLIMIGTFILLIGLLPFASVSEQINGFGFAGCILILLGGLLLIITTAALDLIILPFLLNLANTLASTINGPAIATQDALNKIISSLNSLGSSVLGKLFPGSTPHIPTAQVPLANGITLVNQALAQLHLPTIDRLQWWGHLSYSGAPLTIGSVILGLTLLRRNSNLLLPGILLILFALLNLLCDLAPAIPFFYGNITAALLFLTLAWLAIPAWSAQRPNSETQRE